MGNKLFVGNLAFSSTNESLKAFFEQCGTVTSAKVITDKNTGRSKGFGFVEMSSDAEAGAASEKLNGQSFEGRAITVAEAKPQEPRSDRPRSFGGGGGGRGFGGGGGGGHRGGGNRGGPRY